MSRRKGGNFLTNAWEEIRANLPGAKDREEKERARIAAQTEEAKRQGTLTVYNTAPSPPGSGSPSPPSSGSSSSFSGTQPGTYFGFRGGRTSKIGRTFDRCVKSVRRTVRARKGSTKEEAAIAICTTSVLHTRGKTMKRYRKGRLTTQRKFRGGA